MLLAVVSVWATKLEGDCRRSYLVSFLVPDCMMYVRTDVVPVRSYNAQGTTKIPYTVKHISITFMYRYEFRTLSTRPAGVSRICREVTMLSLARGGGWGWESGGVPNTPRIRSRRCMTISQCIPVMMRLEGAVFFREEYLIYNKKNQAQQQKWLLATPAKTTPNRCRYRNHRHRRNDPRHRWSRRKSSRRPRIRQF